VPHATYNYVDFSFLIKTTLISYTDCYNIAPHATRYFEHLNLINNVHSQYDADVAYNGCSA